MTRTSHFRQPGHTFLRVRQPRGKARQPASGWAGYHRRSQPGPLRTACAAASLDGDYDAVVVGAGVVGLAVARQLAEDGAKVAVLERRHDVGLETSARNSQILHGGLYYPTGSLKARLCVLGREALYAYARARGVDHACLGKLVVAQNEVQEAVLERLLQQARENGVAGCELVSGEECVAMEPHVRARSGLHCPVTGIVDAPALMRAFVEDIEAAGGNVACSTSLRDAQPTSGGFELSVEATSGGAPATLRTTWLVNAAGLAAHTLSASIRGLPPSTIPSVRYAKGNYFSVPVKGLFSRLVYPVPEDGGLGAHLTLGLDGSIKFGPDVEWLEAGVAAADVDMGVDEGRRGAFLASVRRFWPGVEQHAFEAAFSGLRPKLVGPGEQDGDFVLQGAGEHGVRGLVCMYGIESPGLTSCLALGQEVAALLQREEAAPELVEAA